MTNLPVTIPTEVFKQWLDLRIELGRDTPEDTLEAYTVAKNHLHEVYDDETEFEQAVIMGANLPDWVVECLDHDQAVQAYCDHEELHRITHFNALYVFAR